MNVAWYVHHQGAGHAARLQATVGRLAAEPLVLSSLARPAGSGLRWVDLPLDVAAEPVDPEANGTLHWAPLRHGGLRARMAAIAAALAAMRADVLVVDVSVEVALLGRLLGVPTVLVGQRGVRLDAAHALAYAQARSLVLPWSAAADRPATRPPVRRTVFCGAVSRFDDCRPFARVAPGGDVLAMLGSGGHTVPAAAIAAAARATGRTWHVAGALRVEAPGVVDHGPAADVEALLRRCSVVVGSAGGNIVAEVAAARRPFVCLPQPRPFDEQAQTGEVLAELGVAVVAPALPEADAWPGLLADAEGRDVTRWDALHDGHGAARLAAEIEAVATPPVRPLVGRRRLPRTPPAEVVS